MKDFKRYIIAEIKKGYNLTWEKDHFTSIDLMSVVDKNIMEERIKDIENYHSLYKNVSIIDTYLTSEEYKEYLEEKKYSDKNYQLITIID